MVSVMPFAMSEVITCEAVSGDGTQWDNSDRDMRSERLEFERGSPSCPHGLAVEVWISVEKRKFAVDKRSSKK